MSTNNTPETEEPKAPPTVITSLAELDALCRKRSKVEFDLNGQKCSLEVRKLTPMEESKVNEIVESVTPAVIKGKTPEEDRLDLTNAKYIKDKNDASLKARAQALYWAVPAFQEGKPGLTDPNLVRDYVQGLLTEPILNMLWNATRESGVNLAELVNFTLSSGSRGS